MLCEDQPGGVLAQARSPLRPTADVALQPMARNTELTLQSGPWTAPRSHRAIIARGREVFRWLALLICSALITALLAVVGDASVRSLGSGGVSLRSHLTAGVGLYAAVAAAVGLLGVVVTMASASLRARVTRRSSVAGALATPTLVGMVAVWAAADAVRSTMAGAVERSQMGSYLVTGTLLSIGVAAMAVAGFVQVAVSAIERGRVAFPLAGGLLMIVVAALLGSIDLTVMVALYASAHAMLEVTATSLSVIGWVLLLHTAARSRPRVQRVTGWIAIAALAWLGLFTTNGGVRSKVGTALAHVWREPGYVGRMLLRLQLAEDFLSNPTRWRGSLDSRLQRLARRFDISTMALNPIWDLPSKREPSDTAKAMQAARPAEPLNIVVFYVDTLRADTASNRQVMPNMTEFGEQSLRFRRAYSSASDTVDALPVLTGGCWGAVPCKGDLLGFAKERGIPRTLVIAKSAARFLAKLSPHFEFDQTVDIPDYEEGASKVWGYGADRPTAAGVSEQTLAWIDGYQGSSPFLLWSFHFDVHNWKELDEGYLRDLARQRGIAVDEEDPRWRYDAAAAGVDDALARLLAGLKERGLDRKTVVLVVSDHGEGLGQHDHLRHAVYLWDSLIRVPLMLRAPGLGHRDVDAPVGHVDVAPTLARYLDLQAPVDGYHGSDLLHHTLNEPVPGTLPILLLSMRKDDLLRVGLVSREAPYHKLVLPLESVEPELHDVDLPQPDDVDLARERSRVTLGMISSLVTSPVFPRPETPVETAAVAP